MPLYLQAKLEAQQPAYGFRGTLSAEGRAAAALLDSCERYAAEARRLLQIQEAGHVAESFLKTKRALEAVLTSRQ